MCKPERSRGTLAVLLCPVALTTALSHNSQSHKGWASQGHQSSASCSCIPHCSPAQATAAMQHSNPNPFMFKFCHCVHPDLPTFRAAERWHNYTCSLDLYSYTSLSHQDCPSPVILRNFNNFNCTSSFITSIKQEPRSCCACGKG